MSYTAGGWWKGEFRRLEVWCRAKGYGDHSWTVKTWDEGADVRGHLICNECREQYGRPELSQNKKAISNVFTNFKRTHFHIQKHIGAYCRRRDIPVASCSPASVGGLEFDHDEAIKVGLLIVEKVNAEVGGEEKVFSVYPPVITPLFEGKSYLFKVNCEVCKKLHTDLCPKKENLEHNLLAHVASQSHVAAIGEADCLSMIEVRTGPKRGRPKKPDDRDQAPSQKSILRWFKSDGERPSPSSSRGGLPEFDLSMSLMCWGIWKENVKWKGTSYMVKGVLDDQRGGHVWDLEKSTRGLVYHPQSNTVVEIDGCFRHKKCLRLSLSGGGFDDLTCSKCDSITLEDDFRGRVHRETEALVHRGERTTQNGTRLDYLTVTELQNQVHTLNTVHRKQAWLLALQTQKVCALSTRRMQLQDLLGVAADRKDLRVFLRNIVNGHRDGAFGGKEGLWDFLTDVAKNLGRKKAGFRYSGRTKAIAQAMLQFGGRQVAHCFEGNLGGPNLKTLKRDRAKLVPFRAGLRVETFKEVCRVLSAAKRSLGIEGDVPVIFAEDETRIKERPRWESKYDILIGFCGSSECHTCSIGLEIPVGEGEEGYERIISAFQDNSKGSYARVVIVNPLHQSLPKLALCATATCNKFSADWVREHWVQMKACWDEHCRKDVGPLLGHASDGDARRRKLMLQDYRGQDKSHPRYDVGWEGWSYSVAILPSGDLYGFGDQDQPHNGKKLLNPLDRVSSILVLGVQHAALTYLLNVYNNYPIEDHGLNWDDVNRTDRQNWAGPQRMASRKVQACLKHLHERTDIRHERSLGTQLYLEICGDYIDIFYSKKLSLRGRVVLAGKVSFFFRLWRLWLRFGDHSVGGNVTKHTEKDMVSIQAFHDVNMSCHFIVLLICAFRDKFPSLAIPFHLLGSDCCEIFFSKVGGMSGHERNYDFGSLLDSTVGLNRLAGLEYGPEGLKVGRSHKKQDHVWGKLHPLLEGEVAPDLRNYSQVQRNELVVDALKEGLVAAKDILTRLDMSPRGSLPMAKRKWWTSPWSVEAETWPDTTTMFEEASLVDDGEEDQEHVQSTTQNGEVVYHELEDPEDDLNRIDAWADAEIEGVLHAVREGTEAEDPVVELETLGHEVRHVFGSVVQDFSQEDTTEKVVHFVTYNGKRIFKSTLVSQLVGNPLLSKDRLTRVKQVLYYNTGKRPASEMSPNACLVDVGSDCAVVFEDDAVERPSTRSATGRVIGNNKVGVVEKTSRSYWLGRIVGIRKKYNKQWGRSRSPIDLMDKPTNSIVQTGTTCQLMFNWYKPVRNNKSEFLYNTTDLQWIDISNVICSVVLTMKHGVNRIYVLDSIDKIAIDSYMETLA